MTKIKAIACQCHMCTSVFEAEKEKLTQGFSSCPECHAPLSVLNIVPEWNEDTLTLPGDDAST